MSTLVGMGPPPMDPRAPGVPPMDPRAPGVPPMDPRAPLAPSSDPLMSATESLESEIDRAVDEIIDAARGRPGPDPGDEPPPPTALIERLVDERVQLCADLCQLLWAAHGVEVAIRRELARCSSSHETRAELLRQCFARSRRRLARERDARFRGAGEITGGGG